MSTSTKIAAVTAAIAAAVILGLAVPAAADNNPVIADGEFDAATGSWFEYTEFTAGNIGGITPFGWRVTDGHASIVNGGSEGNSAVLNSSTDPANPAPDHFELTEISQVFPTTPGKTYRVTFWASNMGRVLVDDVALTPPLLPAFGNNSYTFTATATFSTLTFQSPSIHGAGGSPASYLDHVVVVRLPDGPLIDPAIGGVAGVVTLLGAAVALLVRRRTRDA